MAGIHVSVWLRDGDTVDVVRRRGGPDGEVVELWLGHVSVSGTVDQMRAVLRDALDALEAATWAR
jgi:hypothetical protein